MSSEKDIKSIIREQYKKCVNDPNYFMRQYCYIQHPIEGKIKFNLFDFQEDTLTQLRDNRYNVILKSRQLGISTLCAGYALWSMLFNEDFNVLVIATTQDVAKNLVSKVQTMNENLPSWLKTNITTNNKLSLKLKTFLLLPLITKDIFNKVIFLHNKAHKCLLNRLQHKK